FNPVQTFGDDVSGILYLASVAAAHFRLFAEPGVQLAAIRSGAERLCAGLLHRDVFQHSICRSKFRGGKVFSGQPIDWRGCNYVAGLDEKVRAILCADAPAFALLRSDDPNHELDRYCLFASSAKADRADTVRRP